MNEDKNIIVGFDAKRIVRNGTGLGAYGRNLVNDLSDLYPTGEKCAKPAHGVSQEREKRAAKGSVEK